MRYIVVMNISEARTLAEDLMRHFGLINKGWRLQFDSAKRRYGQCIHADKMLRLSEPLTLANQRTEVEETIRHEIAHAMVGSGHGHDRVWKAMALACGANAKACAGEEHVSLAGKFAARCGNCGNISYRFRAPKSVCAHCFRKYGKLFALKHCVLNYCLTERLPVMPVAEAHTVQREAVMYVPPAPETPLDTPVPPAPVPPAPVRFAGYVRPFDAEYAVKLYLDGQGVPEIAAYFGNRANKRPVRQAIIKAGVYRGKC